MRHRNAIMIFLIITFFIFSYPINAQQPTIYEASFKLPLPIGAIDELTAYVPDNNSIYIFGGTSENIGWLRTIIKIDLNNNIVKILDETLSFPSHPSELNVAYNTNDKKIYLFHLYSVSVFDSKTEIITPIAQNILPERIHTYSKAKYVSSEDVIYLIGNRGSSRGNFTLRFDSKSNLVQRINSIMEPVNNTQFNAAYNLIDEAIYIFGGHHSNSYYNLIQKFNVNSKLFSRLTPIMPINLGDNTSVYVGFENSTYIIGGGTDGNFPVDHVYKFNHTTESIELFTHLPMPLHHAGVEYASVSGNIYIIGGDICRTWGYGGAIDKIFFLSLNQPPTANAGEDQTIECTSCCENEVQLTGSASSDPDNDPLTYKWYNAENELVAEGVNPTVFLPLGSHTITLIVNDGNVDSEPDQVTINITDTTPPEIVVSVDPTSLWPPNHKMVDIVATVTATDKCDENPTVKLVSIESNEPDNGLGDGDKANDIQDAGYGTEDYNFKLRAERSGNGDGRIYTITYSGTDASGNTSEKSATVTVGHDMSKRLAQTENAQKPDRFQLFPNYPNPFNPTTEISFALPNDSEVTLFIYNTSGQLVRRLVSGQFAAGTHRLIWNATDNFGNRVASGIYLAVLKAGNFVGQNKLIFMK